MISQCADCYDSLVLRTWAFPECEAMTKRDVRRVMREKRASQDARVAAYKTRKITERVLRMSEVNQAEMVALYVSLPEEAGTAELIQALIEQGKTICLPRVQGKRLRFYAVADMASDLVCSGVYGIAEPNPDFCQEVPPSRIDCFLVPGVAFDLFGHRLGFGGGYYDAYLSQLTSAVPVLGLAFDFQVLHGIPAERHDQPIGKVITEHTVYAMRQQSYLSASEEDTRGLARHLVQWGLGEGHVVLLHADLGTGKTIFVQGLARALQCEEEASSPTFIYCRAYHGRMPLYHTDGYRIDDLQRSDAGFWDELLQQPGIHAIEWGEQFGMRISKNAVHIYGKIVEGGQRRWTVCTPTEPLDILHGRTKFE
jgi:5-formyltetrahydrofolate cyclo-ligase